MSQRLDMLRFDSTIALGDLVWWRDGEGYHSPVRLGRVIASDNGYLVVQVGPDRNKDIIVRPKYGFYRVDAA